VKAAECHIHPAQPGMWSTGLITSPAWDASSASFTDSSGNEVISLS